MVVPLRFNKNESKSLLANSDMYVKPNSSATNCLRRVHRRANSQQFILNNSATKVKELLNPQNTKHQRAPSANTEEIKNWSSFSGFIFKSSGDQEFDRLVSKMNYIHKVIIRKKSQAQQRVPTVPDTIRLSNKAIKKGLIVINKTIRGKAHTPVGL